MKKILIHKALLCMLIIMIPALSYAVDFSLGISGWYTTLDKTHLAGSGLPESSYKSDPVLMYGPALGIQFGERWSFSSVTLYNSTPMISRNQGNIEQEINRLDSDSILNYSINRYFKVFAGVKYQYLAASLPSADVYFWDAGPGLGTGITIPVIDNLFCVINLAGMYTKGRFTNEANSSLNCDLVRYGYNFAPCFAYYIEQISTTVMAGYRYQFYKTEYSNDINDTEMSFYGFTCSVIYHF